MIQLIITNYNFIYLENFLFYVNEKIKKNINKKYTIKNTWI